MDRTGRAPAWRRGMFALALGVTLLALTACGGGGGGGSTPPPVQGGGGQTTPPPADPDVGIAITAISGSPALIGSPIEFTAQAAAGTAPFVYAWNFGDGNIASAAQAAHAYAAAGSYPVSVTVTDARGKTATARSEVRVEAPVNLGIKASRQTLSIGQTVQLTATHDPMPDIARYVWKLGPGNDVEGPSVATTYYTLGSFPVELTVFRTNGLKTTATLTLSTVDTSPSVNAWAYGLPYVGIDMKLVSTGDPKHGPVQWDFGDGTRLEAAVGEISHRFREPGLYKIQATQTNSTGATATASISQTILPAVAPSAVTVSPYQALRNTQAASATVSFSGVSAATYDLSETDRTYRWDFGDGTPTVPGQAGTPIEHHFAAAGTYVVTLTATNAFGLSSLGTATVVVGQRQQLALLAGNDLAQRQVDGPALSATLRGPMRLSFDAVGNLFFVDSGNAAVRKLSTQGVVSTVNIGDADCRKGYVETSFTIAGYGDGGVAVASTDYNCRRGILWDMQPGTAPVNIPVPSPRYDDYQDDRIQGMARDAGGRLHALFAGGTILRRLEANGQWVDVAGKAYEWNRTDGVGADARILASDQSLGFDASGALYYHGITTVHRITADGTVSLIAGAEYVSGPTVPAQDGVGTQARFAGISDMAVGRDGTIIVLEFNKLRKIAPDGVVTTLPVDLSIYGYPNAWSSAIAVAPDGTIVVADGTLNIVRRVNADNTLTVIAGRLPTSNHADGVGAAAGFSSPQGIVQGPSGALYVADGVSRALRKVALDGTVTTLAIIPTPPVYMVNCCLQGENYPGLGGLVVDADENVYVADTATNAVRKVAPNGTVTLIAGIPGSNGWRDGPAGNALFNAPVGIARDAAGNLYVGDTANHVIRKITPAGVVSTVAGTAFASDLVDGTGAAARFAQPTYLVADADGTLWVSDTSNYAIRKVTPAGEVSTVVGRGQTCDTWEDTPLANACVNGPLGIARDAASGDLYYIEGSGGLRQLKANGTIYRLAYGGWGTRLKTGALPQSSLSRARGLALLANGQIAVTTGNAVMVTAN